MAHRPGDRVLETSTSTGTGVFTLAGAVTGFATMAAIPSIAVNDTLPYAIWGVDANGNATGEWEAGTGTYSAANQLTRTTVIRSSNANAAVNFSAGTKYVTCSLIASKTLQLDPVNALLLPTVTAEPPTPSANSVYLYPKFVAGFVVPKIKGPSGVDTILQNAIFQNRVLMYVPSTGTLTTVGPGLGPVWGFGGTISHPAPSSTAPAISNQMRRTRAANVVTTANQFLGVRANAADTQNYWRGNAAGLGGFKYVARFIVELYPASTVRLFAGLTASLATGVAVSDTVVNNTCGLWHDTTDPSTGSGAFNFVTRDTTTTTKQAIVLADPIAAGNSYDFYMGCAPNGTEIFWRLDDIVNNVTYEGSQTLTLPQNTVFMGPQCAMSNGTANITVTTVAIGVAGVYTEADR